jgi:hypothetical protein
MRNILFISAFCVSIAVPFVHSITNEIMSNTSEKIFSTDNKYSSVLLAEVDAESDLYTPPKHIFNYSESLEIKKKLEADAQNNSKNALAVYWSLMKYYSGASTFVGGNKLGDALMYARYIYSLNQYLGCMAFEHVYTKANRLDLAKEWYINSLSVLLPEGMEWKVIRYNNNVYTGIQVKGNFNNWKLQNMYEEQGNVFVRKIMVPKCEVCKYEVFIDYKNNKEPTSIQSTTRIY